MMSFKQTNIPPFDSTQLASSTEGKKTDQEVRVIYWVTALGVCSLQCAVYFLVGPSPYRKNTQDKHSDENAATPSIFLLNPPLYEKMKRQRSLKHLL